MSSQPGEFVFIILKPAAAKDKQLTNYICNRLLQYGNIQYIKYFVNVKRQIISEHYKASQKSFWYPFVVNYLTHKHVHFFILETYPDFQEFLRENYHTSFARFLKTKVIGSADLCKTKRYHLRRLAIRKGYFFIDNLIHSSDNIQEALEEIRLWYHDAPEVIAEFEKKALDLSLVY
ncbi:MAG: nucleoside-diphosphate kinase [Nostocaceae cyanobacterium]|nr:nucleoside-diphosphate kinase [Nostocaceae cyanobacterium]